MLTMKLFFVMLLFNSTALQASPCDEMVRDLLAIENQIQNSKAYGCEKKIREKPPGMSKAMYEQKIVIPGKKKFCKTKLQLEQEYNQALAELVVAEGIKALQVSIAGNYQALAHLSKKDFDDVENYVSEYDKSLHHAEILYDAVSAKKAGNHFFHDFDGDTAQDVLGYIGNGCKKAENSSLKICQKLGCAIFPEKSGTPACVNVSKFFKQEKNLEDMMTTIAGFLNIYRELPNRDYNSLSGLSDNRPTSYVNSFVLPGLKVQVEDESQNGVVAELSPEDLKKHESYQKTMALRRAMQDLKNAAMDQDLARSKVLASKALQISKELDQYNLNFKPVRTSGGAQIDDEYSNFVSSNFQNPLADLDMPDLLQNKGIRKGFNSTRNLMKSDIARANAALEKEMQGKIPASERGSFCPGGKVSVACLEERCGNGIACTLTPDKYGISSIFDKYQSVKQSQEKSDVLAQAAACLDKPNYSPQMRKACIEQKTKGKINTNVSALRSKVQDLEQQLKNQDSVEPFVKLTNQKMMALNVYKTNYCPERKKEVYTAQCGESNRAIYDEALVKFGIDGKTLGIKLNQGLLQKALYDKSKTTREDIDAYRATLIEQCDQGDNNYMNKICSYYKERTLEDDRVAKREKRINKEEAQMQKLALEYAEDNSPSYWKEGLTAAGFGLLQSTPQLFQAYAEYDYTKWSTKAQIDSIERTDEIYMAGLANFRANMLDPNAYTPIYYRGFGIRGNTLHDYSSFQLESSLTNQLLARPLVNTSFVQPVPNNLLPTS